MPVGDLETIPSRVTLTEIAMTGQPASDKAFVTANGTKIRARVIVVATQTPDAPVNGVVTLASSGVTLSISIAVLDNNMQVRQDGTGAYMVFDRYLVGLTGDGLGNGEIDPAEVIETALEQQAAVVEAKIANQTAISSYLSDSWGVNLLPIDQI